MTRTERDRGDLFRCGAAGVRPRRPRAKQARTPAAPPALFRHAAFDWPPRWSRRRTGDRFRRPAQAGRGRDRTHESAVSAAARSDRASPAGRGWRRRRRRSRPSRVCRVPPNLPPRVERPRRDAAQSFSRPQRRLVERRQSLSAVRATVQQADPRIGLIAVLHTWGQTLTHHPHVHCLVPGGGVALDGQRWVACKPNFLLSVRVLSKTFRRLFLDGLAAVFRRGELGFFGELAPLADPGAFAGRVRALRQSPFVFYAKPPFGGPERVLAYLARYTHRTAIANSRIVAVDDNEVAFSYKDYRRGGRSGVMRLAPHEFIRRFLLHVLPDGFHRIRHYGFLAKGDRGETLARVRHLLQVEPPSEPDVAARNPQADQGAREPSAVCPDCGGLMRRIGHVAESPATAFRCDTS